MHNSKCIIRALFLLFCILNCALCVGSCSIPNLEKPECTQARDTVKQFYSWYLGTDAKEKAKHTDIYDKFISPTFRRYPGEWETDPYLLTNDFPKTFRVGVCKSDDVEHADLQVLLLWHKEEKNIQRELMVETIKVDDRWLINKVQIK